MIRAMLQQRGNGARFTFKAALRTEEGMIAGIGADKAATQLNKLDLEHCGTPAYKGQVCVSHVRGSRAPLRRSERLMNKYCTN